MSPHQSVLYLIFIHATPITLNISHIICLVYIIHEINGEGVALTMIRGS